MLAMDDPEGIAMSFGETDVTTLELIFDACSATTSGVSLHSVWYLTATGETLAGGNMLAVVRYMRKLSHNAPVPAQSRRRVRAGQRHRPLAI